MSSKMKCPQLPDFECNPESIKSCPSRAFLLEKGEPTAGATTGGKAFNKIGSAVFDNVNKCRIIYGEENRKSFWKDKIVEVAEVPAN